ncbi:MAG: NAD(P)/FAD-dependent oxidoreductase [Ignavibacteriaceae bacterium]|nr:NAD(P)/FAD-dependent oxidoreductase [Ignavibacteriaceae bacterium]
MKKENNIIIIGGGAAGFFAAIASAEKNLGNNIIILEKGDGVLSKVKISGGGRCNVTNSCTDPRELVKYYPRGGKELLSPFYKFNPGDTIEWFERQGVKLKTEPDGRIFSASNDSQTIVDCLVDSAISNNIKVLTQSRVTNIQKTSSGNWNITSSGKEFQATSVIICSGSSNSIWKIINNLGHKIEFPIPSLFTFNIKDNRIEGISGISVPDSEVRIEGTKLKSTGPLLITHWGMSGPAILKISAWGARELYARDYKFRILINWLPGTSTESVKEQINQVKINNISSNIYSFSPFALPIRLWQRLLEHTGINKDVKWNNLSGSLLNNLAMQLAESSFNVNGKSTFKEEFVTCGGVCLNEIDFKSMESKLHKGLFFAGEVLNIDALTGGFNFQAAWTTGWIAGNMI